MGNPHGTEPETMQGRHDKTCACHGKTYECKCGCGEVTDSEFASVQCIAYHALVTHGPGSPEHCRALNDL